MKVKIYKDAAKEWRWQIKARNGEIIAASSESFKRRKFASANLDLVHKALTKYFDI